MQFFRKCLGHRNLKTQTSDIPDDDTSKKVSDKNAEIRKTNKYRNTTCLKFAHERQPFNLEKC